MKSIVGPHRKVAYLKVGELVIRHFHNTNSSIKLNGLGSFELRKSCLGNFSTKSAYQVELEIKRTVNFLGPGVGILLLLRVEAQ